MSPTQTKAFPFLGHSKQSKTTTNADTTPWGLFWHGGYTLSSPEIFPHPYSWQGLSYPPLTQSSPSNQDPTFLKDFIPLTQGLHFSEMPKMQISVGSILSSPFLLGLFSADGRCNLLWGRSQLDWEVLTFLSQGYYLPACWGLSLLPLVT